MGAGIFIIAWICIAIVLIVKVIKKIDTQGEDETYIKDEEKAIEDYLSPNNGATRRIKASLDLQNKINDLNGELSKLRHRQRDIIKTFDNSEYKNSDLCIFFDCKTSQKESAEEDLFYGVDVHCDFCDEIYSIKERCCPNCKADNPYWKDISDFK